MSTLGAGDETFRVPRPGFEAGGAPRRGRHRLPARRAAGARDHRRARAPLFRRSTRSRRAASWRSCAKPDRFGFAYGTVVGHPRAGRRSLRRRARRGHGPVPRSPRSRQPADPLARLGAPDRPPRPTSRRPAPTSTGLRRLVADRASSVEPRCVRRRPGRRGDGGGFPAAELAGHHRRTRPRAFTRDRPRPVRDPGAVERVPRPVVRPRSRPSPRRSSNATTTPGHRVSGRSWRSGAR